jgi:hypothetical protein
MVVNSKHEFEASEGSTVSVTTSGESKLQFAIISVGKRYCSFRIMLRPLGCSFDEAIPIHNIVPIGH